LEALDCNFKRGFEFFEIDFSWTADNQLVCIHDWKETFSRFFAFSITEKPTLETFKFLVRNVSKYHICTLSDLADWMKKHPNTRLITDVKSDNIKALQLISKTIDDFSFRVIPQIYQPNEYEIAKKLGYKNIIWTLYKFNGSNNKVIELIDSFNLFAVTMPQIRAKENLGNVLKRKGIPTYVHTINSIEKVNEYVNNYGISEIYTDFLPPY
jgi:glycerophosphoryl diester phosphodiesterase